MRMRFDMQGIRTDIAAEELMRRMFEGMKDACVMMEEAVVDECPEGEHEGSDTVALAMTIAHKVRFEGTSVIGTVGTGADYAVYNGMKALGIDSISSLSPAAKPFCTSAE